MPEIATCREVGSVTIVTLRGRIQLGEGTTALRDTVRELLAKSRIRIILNLSEVISIDSAGIAEIIGTFVPLKTRGGGLRLLSPTKTVHDLLEATQLCKVLEVYFEEEAALGSFH